MHYSSEDMQTLSRRLRPYRKDVYAKDNLAYQHFEIDGQVIIEGEHKERTAERQAWLDHSDLRGKTVLDLGCNLGLFTTGAARHGATTATGIDIQPSVIEAARTIGDFFGLHNADFDVVDLTSPSAREQIATRDVVFAFAIYDHLTGRHKQVVPWARENEYLQVTEWLARITGHTLLLEFHNDQMRWVHFYEQLLQEHGFDIIERKVTRFDRPVFFCRRSSSAHDEMIVDGQVFKKIRSWPKRYRRIYLLEKDDRRFLCKRYAVDDMENGRLPEHEARITAEFAGCPDVIQPICHDERRIVFPYFEGRPLQVIDEQPMQPASLESPALCQRIVYRMSALIARYLERREELFKRYALIIPERYREEVKEGHRLLVDVCPSNVLVAGDGEIRFVDFEPSKPPLTHRILKDMQGILEGRVSQPRKHHLRRLLRFGHRFRSLTVVAGISLWTLVSPARDADPPGATGSDPFPLDAELHELTECIPDSVRFRAILVADYVRHDPRNARDSGLRLDRAAVRLDGNFGPLAWRVVPDLRGIDSKHGLEEAWASLEHSQALRVCLGLLKIPLGVEHAVQAEDLPFAGYSFPAYIDGRTDCALRLDGQFSQGIFSYDLTASLGAGYDLNGQQREDPQYSLRVVSYPLRASAAGQPRGRQIDLLSGLFVGAAFSRTSDYEGELDVATPLRNKLFDTPEMLAGPSFFFHVNWGWDAGPLQLAHEFVRGSILDLQLPDGTLRDLDDQITAWQATASWMLTGEHYDSRPYLQREGRSGPFPARPLAQSADHPAGIGAWEIAVRYSNADIDRDLFVLGITDYSISSQEFRTFSGAVNWYVSRSARCTFQVVRSIADQDPAAFEGNRDTSFVFRTQLIL